MSISRSRQQGVSLIELIMFIVIVSVALAGIMVVMDVTTKSSADPLVHKQALAIAESLLEEVELMPFTICDPNDVNAASAVTAADCTGGYVEALGPETISGVPETRHSATDPFDNVNDYNGFTSTADGGVKDIAGNAIGGLGSYTAQVSVVQQSVGGIAAAESSLITVTVTGADGQSVVVEGVRTRYAPRTVP